MAFEAKSLQLLYIQAVRNWECNNLRESLALCEYLSRNIQLQVRRPDGPIDEHMLNLKHLVWFLKIKCLASTYHVNESLLLNEEDIEGDSQAVPLSSERKGTSIKTTSRAARPTTAGPRSRDITTSGARILHQKSGILTGRMPGVSSRHSVQAASSYRPLTTGLSGTQTAFSRSTKPLLKFSKCKFISKFIYEYLYNAQISTNACPDYRQCLEYLNLVERSLSEQQQEDRNSREMVSSTDRMKKLKSVHWLIAFGVCYFNLNMNKEAEEYFLRAKALNSRYLESYTWLIRVYLKMGEPRTVLKMCAEALKNCKNPIIYNWMSRVQSLQGDQLVANASLRKSLKLCPTNFEALANVGYFAFYGDELELSLSCFNRIYQLTLNQIMSSGDIAFGLEGTCQLLNNLALCNFYCGNYQNVIPFFMRSFISSPNKETTSDIWYNLSFIPLSCGMKNIAIACLEIALKNDSQNLEALNNLGVLKFKDIVGEPFHFSNMFEVWSSWSSRSNEPRLELEDCADEREYSESLNNIETYFSLPNNREFGQNNQFLNLNLLPEMLFNMAVIKRKRGHLLDCVRYCNLYLNHDPDNYQIYTLLEDVRKMVFYE